MAQSRLGKADRFYANPALRDAEWNQATTPPAWFTILVIAIVAVSFIAGVYAAKPLNTLGWIVGTLAIAVYFGLGPWRRRRARQRLRELHGQTV